MAKSKKAAPPTNTPAEPITEFAVSDGGTLCMADFADATTRAEFYEGVADRWEGSPKNLADAIAECEPLAWAVQLLYTNFREKLEEDIRSAEDGDKPNRKEIASLKARLEAMPQEPFDGTSKWLRGLTTTEFETLIVPSIQAWFAEPPDWDSEDDHLPESGTAQEAALDLFRSMDADDVDLLGVDLVKGEHPGSSYYAAELRGDIDVANRVAEAAGPRLRFVKG